LKILMTMILILSLLFAACSQETPVLSAPSPDASSVGDIEPTVDASGDAGGSPDSSGVADSDVVESQDSQEISETPDTEPGADVEADAGVTLDVSDDAGAVNCDPEDDPCMACVCKADGTKICVPREAGAACEIENCCVTDSVCGPCAAGALCPESGWLCQGPDKITCEDPGPCSDSTPTCFGVDCVCHQTHFPDGAVCTPDEDGCYANPPVCKFGACIAGPYSTVDDQNPCTADACVAGQIVHEPISGDCDDGDPCTVEDYCVAGQCIAGSLKECAASECQVGAWCDTAAGGCVYETAPDGVVCVPSELCALTSQCVNGTCETSEWLDCDDYNPCTDQWCGDVAGICMYVYSPLGMECGPTAICLWGECTETTITPPSVNVVPDFPPPKGDDDLLCVITQDSSTNEEGALTYAFTWATQAGPTFYTSDTIPASATADCEEWTCTVTPFLLDIPGPPASDSAKVIDNFCVGCPEPGDQDGDQAPDESDNCPDKSNPMQDDTDGDGLGDACDPCWLDGPTPVELDDIVGALGVTVTNVTVNGGPPVGYLSPGELVTVDFDYEVSSCDCPGCITQYIVGFGAGNPCNGVGFDRACFYNGGPGCSSSIVGEVPDELWVKEAGGEVDLNASPIGQLVAPDLPGMYFIGLDQKLHYSCHQGLETWMYPDDNLKIGAFCVK
jgi:hypothetical protein